MESQENMSSPSSTYPLGPLLPQEHHVLSRWLSSQGVSQEYSPPLHNQYLSSSSSSQLPPNYILLPFNKSIGQGVLRFLSSSELRKRVYAILTAQPVPNLSLLCRLIILRHKLSCLMGFSSYNERILSRKVLKNSSVVLLMLEKLSQATKQQTTKEIKSLEDLKEKFPSPSPSSPSSVEKKVVYPWDINYLGDLYVQTHLQGSSSSKSSSRSHDQAVQEFSQYCHLETCLNGLEFVCQSVFGITLKREMQMNPSEIWTDHPEDLIKYTLYHRNPREKDEIITPLGTIYLDPFVRDHKFGGASHFTIRCGCSNSLSSASTPEGSATVGYQLPIVALVFSFPKDPNGVFLSPNQFENLYHEWGHALHSLLSRTKFQHLSGTRGSTDFVEVRSSLHSPSSSFALVGSITSF
jgi:mitochondrial intermediate peptidase